METFLSVNAFNFFSLLIGVLLFFHADYYFKQSHEKRWKKVLAYFSISQLLDIITIYFTGLHGETAVVFSYILNTLLFLFSTMLTVHVGLFLCSLVGSNKKKTNILKKVLYGTIIINGILLLITIPTGIIFSIDANNVYSRGSLYFIMIIFILLPILLSFFKLLIETTKNKRKILYDNKVLLAILMFSILSTVFLIYLQGNVDIIGSSIVFAPLSFSILVLHLMLVSSSITVDYLTKAQNKFGIELYFSQLPSKIDEYFVVIFFDLDVLKEINDKFGHAEGDIVLIDFAKILMLKLHKKMMAGRLGGDEFLILLRTKNLQTVNSLLEEINKEVQHYNKNKLNYKLKYSYGVSVCEPNEVIEKDKLIEEADKKMYEQKSFKKQTR